MNKQIEALKRALEALEESLGYVQEEAENAQRLYGQYPTRQARIQGLKDDARKHMEAITATREALAEQPAQQEPVAWITQGGKGWLRWHNKNDDHLNKTSVPLYKHPKRKPLSDAEIALISAECSLRTPSDIYFARAIEAAHGIKGDA